jgi:hypothetical protein
VRRAPRSAGGYSVVRRRYSQAASGANTAIRTTDQSREATTGCCIGQAWIEAEGLGLNRALMALHQRNQSAVEDLHRSERHRLENDDMERQFRRLLSSPDIPVAMRVRMACSIGAVMGGMLGTSLLDDVPDDELTDLVREAVSDMFASPRPAN